jgi:tetratricopeptide (TPR) repeat protein
MKGKQDPTKDLKDAIKALTTPSKDKGERGDSLGRAYYLGQAYILMLQVPGAKPIGRRGDYGIATDTILSIDLLAAADTAFSKVEMRMPECAPELAKWRQQKPWLDALNGAITAMNTGQYDSAEVLAKRSLIIDRTTPYAYSILGNVASNRKDYAAATNLFKQSLALAEKDTAYNDARLTAIFDLANTATQRANSATGSDKKDLVQEAINDWHTFIPVGTRDIQVANAEQIIVQLYKSMGDSSKIADAYSQVIADPSKFEEQTLLNAGVISTRARKPQDAVTLFAAVLDRNPNQRDALNNLAASYVGTKEQSKMFPLIDRLVAIDPNNPGNWMLYAYAYTGLLKGTKDPKEVKAYTDSLVKYNAKAEKMMTRVSLNEFSHTQQSTTLSGTIENRAATAKSYTIQIEFLDKAGAVIDTQTVNVGPVLSKDTTPFTTTTQSPKAAAFRYKITP